MKRGKSVGLLAALAFVAWASDVAAQASPESHPGATQKPAAETAIKPADMLHWSFGDCDNKFPYVTSNEHKECVRVVGSEEARDARAYKICETSNARDPEGIAQCKSTYKANKDRSAQSGYVPNKAGQPQQQAAPTAEDMQRVRAITAVAVENDKARVREAAQAVAAATPAAPAEPEPTPEPEEPEGPSTLVVVLALVAAGGGSFAWLQRRRQSNALSAR